MEQITEEESPVAVAVAVASIDDTVKQCNEEEIKKEKDGQTVQTPVVESHVCEISHTIAESTDEKIKPPQSLVEEEVESSNDEQELIIRPEASLSLPDGTLPEKDQGHGKDVQEPNTNTNKDAVALALACQLKRKNDSISSRDLFTCATTSTSTSTSTSTAASGEATQYGSLGEYFKSTLGSSKKAITTLFGVKVESWPVGSACLSFSFSQQRQRQRQSESECECASGTGSNSIIFGPTPPAHSDPPPHTNSTMLSPRHPRTSRMPSTSLEAEAEAVHSTVEQTAKSWAAAVVHNFLSHFPLRQPTTTTTTTSTTASGLFQQTTPAFVSTNLLSAGFVGTTFSNSASLMFPSNPSASASASGSNLLEPPAPAQSSAAFPDGNNGRTRTQLGRRVDYRDPFLDREHERERFSDGFHARRRAPRFRTPCKRYEGRQWSWVRNEEKEEQMAKSPVAVAVAVPLIQDKVQQYSNKEEELNKGAEASCQLKRKGAFTSSSADMLCPKNAKKRKIDQTVLYNCTLCQVTVAGEGQLLCHLNGNRHQTVLKRLAKLDINKQVDSGTKYKCTLNWTQL